MQRCGYRGVPDPPPPRDFVWSIAGAGVGGAPRARSSTCEQRDGPTLLGLAERAPHLSHCFGPTPFSPNPPLSPSGGSLLKRRKRAYTNRHTYGSCLHAYRGSSWDHGPHNKWKKRQGVLADGSISCCLSVPRRGAEKLLLAQVQGPGKGKGKGKGGLP